MRSESTVEKQARKLSPDERDRLKATHDFLCGYRLAADMLQLRKYERRRARPFCDPCDCEELLHGSESAWRARMFEVGSLIDSMPNGREKLMLYYHYVHGESIEHIADVLDVSRRTGYRIHKKGLLTAAAILRRRESHAPAKPV